MFLLTGTPFVMSDGEYASLKQRFYDLSTLLTKTHKELDEVKRELALQMFFHDPPVIISIMKNQKTGDKWLGRVKVPDEIRPYFMIAKDKRFYISFIICDAAAFSDKENPELKMKAIAEAKRTLKKRFQY
jgi:hypothetical protein